MPRTSPDPGAIALAGQVLAVVRQVPFRKLCTVPRSHGSYAARSGLYYRADDEYPNPPVRAHLEDHGSGCANCADFAYWRRTYLARAEENGVDPLPAMVAPATIEREGHAPLPHVTDPDDMWIGFVATMIRLAAEH